MPRHGLNQLLNSISVCLVLLTGLGIGAWVSQLGQVPQSAPPADSYADSHAEEEDEHYRQPVKRKQVRRNPVKKRTLASGKVRQVTYQQEEATEEQESLAQEPEGTSLESNDNLEAIPLRVAAAPPNPAIFTDVVLGQTVAATAIVKYFRQPLPPTSPAIAEFDSLIYPIPFPFPSDPLMLTGDQFTLGVDSTAATPNNFAISIYKVTPGPVVDLAPGAPVTVSGLTEIPTKDLSSLQPQPIQPGKYTAGVRKDGESTAQIQSPTVGIQKSTLDQVRYPKPTIATYSHTESATEQAVTGNAVTVSTDYLRLSGTGLQNLQFYYFDNDPRGTTLSTTASLPARTKPAYFGGLATITSFKIAGGAWQAELKLPKLQSGPVQGTKGLLICVAKDQDNFVYANPIVITYQPQQAFASPPVIAKLTDSGAAADLPKHPAVTDKWMTKNATFKVNLTGNFRAYSEVLILDNKSKAVLGKKASDFAGTASAIGSVDVTLPGRGEYEFVAAFAEGDGTKRLESTPIQKILYQSDGPTIANFGPRNFGTVKTNVITIDFDTAVGFTKSDIEQTPATSPYFKLFKGVTPGNTGTAVTLSGVEYSAADNRVTLTVSSDVTADTYQLQILATLADAAGNPLRGDGLTPGKKAILNFSAATASADNIDIPAPKRVKHVDYQEYTQGRTNPPDFLPSDHVETRVSRLYYFRDAHRVAQIMNRGVESLNRAATTMQKQLADKARRQADQGTDERRAFELRASQAAQTARQAEAQLEEEQLAQAQAEQAVETMTQAIEADNVRIAELQDDLTAMQGAAAQTPPPANPPTPQQISQLEAQIQKLQLKDSAAKRTLAAANSDLAASGNRISAAMAAVQTARDKEIKATNDSADAQAKEDRLREDQFRREVAAAQEDPDTYVGGVPTSNDPVAQVSISVIGEGVIQLRGPLSGINKIRQSINQIDQPVGQVRISIHTAQVNGEHGDRMEKVVNRIDNYIEHARFLTTHSTELLRQSILQVAAEKAMQAAAECPNGDQASQEVKYLDAFFGADFIDQLEQMDSEFLRTGNKLLSLHSMDTTSLASALFVMALAKNDTRMEILAVFNSKLEGDLPQSEMNYHQAGFAPVYCGDGKLMARRKLENGKNLERSLMALNAKFVNFSGFFNATVAGPDTLNPTQREFLKLAQIFKSRMITEIELRQRVVERGLIEQNDPDRLKRENDRRILSDNAQQERKNAFETRLKSQSQVANALADAAAKLKGNVSTKEDIDKSEELSAIIDALEKVAPQITENARTKRDTPEASRAPSKSAEMIEQELRRIGKTGITIKDNVIYFTIKANGQEFPARIPIAQRLNSSTIEFDSGRAAAYGVSSTDFESVWNDLIANAQRNYEESLEYLNKFNWESKHVKKTIENERTWSVRAAEGISSQEKNQRSVKTVKILIYGQRNLEPLLSFRMREREKWEQQAATLSRLLVAENYNHQAVLNLWVKLKIELDQAFTDEEKKRIGFEALVAKLEQSFENLGQAVLAVQVAERIAKLNSFPLDHRRFLDFLIAETEDKYIELLEGTRSHTANIDNYIKRLITALDDDFNTQFYKPAFQGVRQASRLWDVSLAQIETTSILTNNRMFGKVSPQATMEFDLPKRDVLIKEALNGAMASYQEYGALLNDPTFLSMTKLRSGQPTSSPSQRGAGESAVRNVLPGLPSATDEQIMGQAGPGNREFDSPLESLIPDPAIYKFETGTGFEVRPVIQPDGQAVVFHFNYMYRTNVREPIRADEKHLGRVKQHFIDTDVQLSNFELRKVSDYTVALKTSRTSRGVPLMEDVPGLGVLFRPLPSAESSLQQNVVMAQATIFPTLFDLMGLRWAPAVADLDEYELQNENHTVRGRRKAISNKVYDFSSEQVDTFLQIPETERRKDLYRDQKPIAPRPPHPDQGYEYLDQPAPNAMPAPGPSDRPNDPRMVPPLPAARRAMPQRQASRIRERAVSAPPAAPGPDAPPAREVEQLPPPLEQPATQQGVQPGAQGQSGPIFIEQLPPNGNSSSSKRRTGIRSVIQPVGGVQADGSKGTSIIDAGYHVEQPRVSRGGPDDLEQVRASKGAPPAAETAGRAKVGSGPAKSGMPRLPKLSWPKRANHP